MEEIILREATLNDIPYIQALYQAAAASGGLARSAEEVTKAYVTDFIKSSLERGLTLVLHPIQDPTRIVGEVHGYTLGLQVFSHVFEHVTMAVHPDYQGKGLGQRLIQGLQNKIRLYFPHIMKIELKCFSHNHSAMRLYQKTGFVIEGRQENRVWVGPDTFADGIFLAWFNPGYQNPNIRKL